ncbi:MAG: DNA-processing protein DprA [Clostridia bacterium]|nr:DNA-processing protein DprA [Clostridia bacterium]
MDNRAYLLALHQAPGIGGKIARKLLDYFGDIKKLWGANVTEIEEVVPTQLANAFVQYKKTVNIEKIYEHVISSGCWFITSEDGDYPNLVKEIFNPPLVIFGKGNKEILSNQCLAIVGCRKPSYYGQQMARKISSELTLSQWTIVSGLAKGIDTCAHMGCLLQQGNTIAVLGSGVDIIYPKENKKIYDEITEKGAIISEYLPGTTPVPGNFPARNRIISGLSLGVLVVEAGEKSGALITADFAMEQGRDVFALPGMVTNPYAKGTHSLIKQGAKLIEAATDIIQEYYPERLFYGNFGNSKNEQFISGVEKQLLLLIEKQPLHIDEICFLAHKTIMEISPVLLQMEMKGLIKQLPGKIYSYMID